MNRFRLSGHHVMLWLCIAGPGVLLLRAALEADHLAVLLAQWPVYAGGMGASLCAVLLVLKGSRVVVTAAPQPPSAVWLLWASLAALQVAMLASLGTGDLSKLWAVTLMGPVIALTVGPHMGWRANAVWATAFLTLAAWHSLPRDASLLPYWWRAVWSAAMVYLYALMAWQSVRLKTDALASPDADRRALDAWWVRMTAALMAVQSLFSAGYGLILLGNTDAAFVWPARLQVLVAVFLVPAGLVLWRQRTVPTWVSHAFVSLIIPGAAMAALSAPSPYQIVQFHMGWVALLFLGPRWRSAMALWVAAWGLVAAVSQASAIGYVHWAAACVSGGAVWLLMRMNDALDRPSTAHTATAPRTEDDRAASAWARWLAGLTLAGGAVGLWQARGLPPGVVIFFGLGLALLAVGVGAVGYGLRHQRHLRADLNEHRRNADALALMNAHRAAQARLQLETEDLQAAREAAEQSARFKGEFLANMSHEIRTPINGIRGFWHQLSTSSLTPSQHQHVALALRVTDELTQTLNDVLDLAKLEADRLTLTPEVTPLRALAEGLVHQLMPQASGKGLRFGLRCAADVPPYVLADPNRLHHVLHRLLAHALAVTERGEVTLHLGGHRADDRTFVLKAGVTDTSPGLTHAACEALLTPKGQPSPDALTLQDSLGHCGVWLRLSHRLVQAMGSAGVQMAGVDGQGHAMGFDLALPLPSAEAVQAHEAQQRAQRPALTHLNGLRVLLVDDSVINVEVMSHLLGQLGAKVWFATSGEKALALLSQRPSSAFDAVLMDLQMPGMDGLTATARIKSNPDWQDLPVLALTANDSDEDRAAARAAGMVGYLTKPVTAERVLAALAPVWQP